MKDTLADLLALLIVGTVAVCLSPMFLIVYAYGVALSYARPRNLDPNNR